MAEQHQAEIIKLQKDVEVIRDNHLAHMADDIDGLKKDISENRKFFVERMDKLDNRIWWIMGFTVTTLVTVVISVIGTV